MIELATDLSTLLNDMMTVFHECRRSSKYNTACKWVSVGNSACGQDNSTGGHTRLQYTRRRAGESKRG